MTKKITTYRLIGATAAVLMLTGCAGGQEPQVPTPAPTVVVTPTPTPSLSADQADAMAALSNFWTTYDAVFRKEANPNELYKFARGEIMEKDFIPSYNQIQGLGLTREGSVDRFNLTPEEPTVNDGRSSVLISACIDQTQLKLVDKDGVDKMVASSKTVTASQMRVEHWEGEGWFVTAGNQGSQDCAR